MQKFNYEAFVYHDFAKGFEELVGIMFLLYVSCFAEWIYPMGILSFNPENCVQAAASFM